MWIKKHVKFVRLIMMLYSKYAPSLLYIFPHSGKFMNTTPVKIFPFCSEPFIEQFFDLLLQTKALLSKSVTHGCKQEVIGRS